MVCEGTFRGAIMGSAGRLPQTTILSGGGGTWLVETWVAGELLVGVSTTRSTWDFLPTLY